MRVPARASRVKALSLPNADTNWLSSCAAMTKRMPRERATASKPMSFVRPSTPSCGASSTMNQRPSGASADWFGRLLLTVLDTTSSIAPKIKPAADL